jgi:methylphosphotriester-DNA--protein-cysteine methyltransferase
VSARRADPKILPVEPAVTSTRRGWVGLEAAHFRTTPAFELLERDSDLALVDIAASAGFSDQSKLSTHFKRTVGVMPSQFRKSARIA